MLRRKIEALGVRVHTGKHTKSIEAGQSARHVMNFGDGNVKPNKLIDTVISTPLFQLPLFTIASRDLPTALWVSSHAVATVDTSE